ncbi:hypothetical protein C8F04DRAFT_304748, partial [Mycena alexandri]
MSTPTSSASRPPHHPPYRHLNQCRLSVRVKLARTALHAYLSRASALARRSLRILNQISSPTHSQAQSHLSTYGRSDQPRRNRADRRHPHRGYSHAVHGGDPARKRPPPAQRTRHSLRGRRPNPPRPQRRHPRPPGRRPRVPRDDPPRARGPRVGEPRHVHRPQGRRGAPSALPLGPPRPAGARDGDDSRAHAQRFPRCALIGARCEYAQPLGPFALPRTYRYSLCLPLLYLSCFLSRR